ncbi:hypothetical protein CKO32_06130 [Afifella marina DSM 2698]|uniref:Yip1 domain-containing protein n=2 Tax=Afifella marina TaxID=1080 RepID=A0A1G5NCF8_AFIMA|nr:hypothetical protein [Afifella marina DSM 2698]MBK1626131.1 hypothetical protein [Afifella marina]MBK5917009.1 hypothetical protein [Afifella marina]RAI22009.1 hypothetical protein CH311_04645 [Afifella marina DSM 2698]SCZ34310.1 hypothetical protein SAMN03080610_01670 [Afifella marina DSM 2698]
MIFSYCIQQVTGAWKVMNGRAEGLQELDLTLEGFWRSFGAVILIIPFTLIAISSERIALTATDQAVTVLAGSFVSLRLFGLALDWIAFPIFFALVARPLGVSTHYVPFIVARNWSAVVIAGMFALPHALHATGFVPLPVLSFLLLALFVVALRFSYLVVRTALAVPVMMAVPVVLLQLLIGILIEVSLDRIFVGVM